MTILYYPLVPIPIRRYGETLFDILFTGGILAPGGAVVDDGDENKASTTSVCVFECDGDLESLKAFVQVSPTEEKKVSILFKLILKKV